MSDIIQLLPDVVANQIAAGEVIQRPASVVKELIENAVDAGATAIQLVVVDAGRTSIQVIDNGKGMSETDARLSFERHATSKIKSADDLFALQTMGFRGEALASIAAVAQVELYTRRPQDELGIHLSIAGSKVVLQEPCACAVGSNFSIDNLFYNVPARRRFLKSNTTELNHIVTAFERIALVYPHIAFVLQHGETELFRLRSGGLKQRIIDIFGKRMNQELLPIDVNTTMCKLSGFVGKPESARKKCVQQYFFVNGRYMKHPYFHKAVMNVFERLVPQGDQVPYFIYLDVDPHSIDVNIHPTKTEIKFENEQAVWQILFASVRESVGLFNDIPSIDFNAESRPEMPVFSGQTSGVSVPKVAINHDYNPFDTPTKTRELPVENWEDLYEIALPEQKLEVDIFEESNDTTLQTDNVIIDKSPLHYQYKGRYIITSVKSGLMIIDQHRAHMRVLYEKYMRQMREGKQYSQKLLFPEVIQLSVNEYMVFEQMQDELGALGFDFSPLGKKDYAIQSVPVGLEGLDMSELVHQLLVSNMEKNGDAMDDIRHSIARQMAQVAAIPIGQVLNNDEMENLINQLFCCENSKYTPDGKTILHILQQDEINTLFG